MRISCQSFSLPKAGRSFVDCEDAYFPGELNSLQLYEVNHDQTDVFRACVSDGATDSIFSKLWAQLLAFGYGQGKWTSDITAESIKEEQSAWLDFLAKQKLPWYAEEKAELGAFAAMVGLTLLNDSKQWNAMALGDCCIFHVRNGECLKSFPISNSSAFSNFPMLLCSVAERNSQVFQSKQIISDGTWQSGDQFILMSDTVACWFITQIETGNVSAIVNALNSVQSLDAFVSLINHARTTKGADGNVLMRDDDVTVTLISVADDASAPLPQKFDSQTLAAAVRPTVEMPKIVIPETKNTAELPPIPAKRNVASGAAPDLGGTSTVATSVSAATAPAPLSPSSSSPQSPPSPTSQSPSYPGAATGSSGGVAQNASASERSKTGQSRSRSGQPKVAALIVGAIAAVAASIGAVVMFSNHSEKQVKVHDEHQPVSETASEMAKAEEAATKQSSHHRLKHKRKTHPIAITTTGSAPSSARVSCDTPSTVSPNAVPSDSAPVQTPHQSTQPAPQQTPQVAPDRNSTNPVDHPILKTPETMPPQAPDRNHMPLPAPDRNSSTPIQLPHVHRDRGFDRSHSSLGGSQHRSTNNLTGPDKIFPDPSKKNDFEDLSSKKQLP